MYAVKPFGSFDLSDVKLPSTMYHMRSIYETANPNQTSTASPNAGDRLLDAQTEKLSNLSLSDDQPIDLVLQLSPNSLLLDYLTSLRNDLKDKLSISVYRHSSLSSVDEKLIEKWLSLATNLRSCSLSTFNQQKQSVYSLKIILKPEITSNTSSLYKSNSNFKLNGEIKILSLLNHLIASSLSIQVNDLNSLVYNLLLNEYLDYLQQSLNANQVDENRIKYYQTNLQIKSKVLELAEQIFRATIKK